MKRVAAVVAGSIAGAAPSVAFACPVCFAAKDEANRLAFLGTTVFLTSLPVLMIGGLIYWIARRSSMPDNDGEQGSHDATPPECAPEAQTGGELIPLRRGR